jgi:WD40 repeat protein
MGGSIVTLWDLDTGALIDERDLLSNVGGLAWMRGEDHALAAATGGLFVVELADDGSWNRLEKDIPYRQVASVGNRAAASLMSGKVELWRPGYRKTIHSLEGHEGLVEAMAFAPTGELLACGDQAGAVRLWSPQRRRLLHTLKLHKGAVKSVAFSPRSRRLLTGGADGQVVLYDLPTQTELRRVHAHDGGVNSVAWIKDGTQGVSAGQDGTIKVWDLPGQAPAPVYSPLRTYEPGDLIDHPKFGEGEIESVSHDRIQVVFAAETKTLVHARGD